MSITFVDVVCIFICVVGGGGGATMFAQGKLEMETQLNLFYVNKYMTSNWQGDLIFPILKTSS